MHHERYVNGVLIERVTLDPDTNEGTVEQFDPTGAATGTYTRRWVDGHAAVFDGDTAVADCPPHWLIDATPIPPQIEG